MLEIFLYSERNENEHTHAVDHNPMLNIALQILNIITMQSPPNISPSLCQLVVTIEEILTIAIVL